MFQTVCAEFRINVNRLDDAIPLRTFLSCFMKYYLSVLNRIAIEKPLNKQVTHSVSTLAKAEAGHIAYKIKRLVPGYP